eukprot:gene14311-15831_t
MSDESGSEEWNVNEYASRSLDSSLVIRIIVNFSAGVNLFLIGAKLFAVFTSYSKALTAALVDSFVDIACQVVLFLTRRYLSKHSSNSPGGKWRLAALAVIGCAFVMCMASITIIQSSCTVLFNGINGDLPELNVGSDTYLILGIGIGLKFLLWISCIQLKKSLRSVTVAALAENHFHDVLSDIGAVATAAIAYNSVAWWFDPVGAIFISIVTIYRWLQTNGFDDVVRAFVQ